MSYDSTNDTLAHIQRVGELLDWCACNLMARVDLHDQSKLQEPEKSAYDRLTPKLKGLTYGSPEYKASLVELGEALKHHYAVNRHHPEHYRWACAACGYSYSDEQAPEVVWKGGERHRWCPKCVTNSPTGSVIWEAELFESKERGINGMSLFDVIEMLCDWKAAGERHADGCIKRSLQVNRERFKISDQLAKILFNTAVECGWIKEDDE